MWWIDTGEIGLPSFLGIAALALIFAVAVLEGLLVIEMKKEEDKDYVYTKDGEKIRFNEDDQE